MTKKVMYIGACLMLTVALTACGNESKKESVSESILETAQLTTEAETESTQIETDEVVQDETLARIVEEIKNTYGESFLAKESMDTLWLKEKIGLDESLYDAAEGRMPLITTHVDTLIAVKAKEGKVEEVVEVLNNYRDKLINDTLQYPVNIGKINGSKVYQKGNYVFFIMLGEIPMEAIDAGEETAKEAAEVENQKAIDAINSILE